MSGTTKLEALVRQAVAETARIPDDAAPGIHRVEVEAVNAQAARSLYASRRKIYPKLGHGPYRTAKWAVMAVTLGIYYLLPWVRWPRGPGLPDQALLLDFAHQRLFLGPIEVWPQEFYIVTGLLVVAALALFLVTALAGRVWCGYACPQTVWTDLMIAIERLWQGDRNQRMRLDKEPWSVRKVFLKVATHASWMLVGLLTGGALVFYFRDAPTLAGELMTLSAPAVAYMFLGLFTATTYLLGGLAREQVCTYMCPWPRIQGAMFDGDSLLVTYRAYRGEPRAPHKKGESWTGRGDCIDCRLCVAVCPAGIDIREGPQLECIQCALCVDACNDVMAKLGRPRNLIAYDTFRNLAACSRGETAPVRLVRPRTILYTALIGLAGGLTLWSILTRSTLEVSVLRDRDPLFVRLTDGGTRNGYTVKILNKRQQPRSFTLAIRGLDQARLSVVGSGPAEIAVPSDDVRQIKAYVSVPAKIYSHIEAIPFDFVVTDTGDGTAHAATTSFRKPIE